MDEKHRIGLTGTDDSLLSAEENAHPKLVERIQAMLSVAESGSETVKWAGPVDDEEDRWLPEGMPKALDYVGECLWPKRRAVFDMLWERDGQWRVAYRAMEARAIKQEKLLSAVIGCLTQAAAILYADLDERWDPAASVPHDEWIGRCEELIDDVVRDFKSIVDYNYGPLLPAETLTGTEESA